MFDAAAVRAAVVATGAGSRFFTDAVDGAAARGVGEARVVDGVAPVRSRCCSSRRGIDRPRVVSAASASDAVNARMSARMRRSHLLRVRIRHLHSDPKQEFRCVVEVESCLENLGEFG